LLGFSLQVVIPTSKVPAAAGEGLFGKPAFITAPYDEATGTLAAHPLDKRKLGFYTRAPAGREGTSKTVQVKRFREAVRREFKHVDKVLAAGAGAEAAVDGTASPPAAAAAAIAKLSSTRIHERIEREGVDVTEGRPKTLYDFVHQDHTREDWQKTAKDVFYHRDMRPKVERARYGPLAPMSEAYGYGASEGLAAPAHGRKARGFLDKGHIGCNGASITS